MFKEFRLTILLNLLVVCFSQSMFAPNRFDKLLETLTYPMTSHVEAFRDELAKNLKIYTNISFPSEESDDLIRVIPHQKEPREILDQIFKNEIQSQRDIQNNDEDSDSSQKRMLQPVCQNGGQVVWANSTWYYYNGFPLSYDEIISLQKGNAINFFGYIPISSLDQTTKVVDRVEACACPYDFFGNVCEYQIPVMCEIKQNLPPCALFDEMTYSFKFSGDPPCLRVRKGGMFNFNANLDCRIHPLIEDFAREGTKRYQQFIVGEEPAAPFTYLVENSRIKLSQETTGIEFSLVFLNLNKFTDRKFISLNVTARQVAGEDPVVIPVLLDSSLERYYHVGNYYFEMIVKNYVFNLKGTEKEFHYTISNPDFREPPREVKVNKALLIFLLVLIAFLCFAIWWHYRKYKLEQKDQAEKAFYENQTFVDEGLLERPE